jgi:citrate synthase
MLTSEEAARRLGVKLTTLYAYVSRGLLVAHRSGDRRSLFEVDDVEALARHRRPTERGEARLVTIATSVTEIRPEGHRYRGEPAVQLAERASFERVAELLWGVGSGPWEASPIGAPPVSALADRLRWAVVMSGAADPLRSDLREPAVGRAARTIIATMVATLGDEKPADRPVAVADRLAGVLSSVSGPAVSDAIRAALVLLADHELAVSTLAVRTAASTRSDPYDAVLAGLGTAGGPLHAGASRAAHLMLVDSERHGVAAALDDALRWQGQAPGFGHLLYDADPRFAVLWSFVRRLGEPERLQVLDSVLALATERGLPRPNVDLALAALSYAAGMDAETGSVLFKVARVAGWIAHYLEELAERPLRYRVRAVYVTRG